MHNATVIKHARENTHAPTHALSSLLLTLDVKSTERKKERKNQDNRLHSTDKSLVLEKEKYYLSGAWDKSAKIAGTNSKPLAQRAKTSLAAAWILSGMRSFSGRFILIQWP